MATQKTILLTVDVEDWFQVENLRPWYPPKDWHRQQVRVENNTKRMLDLFDAAVRSDTRGNREPITATFFVLGWIAERFPDLIREIHRRGHEVASHGFGHLMCDRLDRKELEDDLQRSRHLLEDIIGHKVKGYRAPNFSVSDRVLASVQAAGYRYDSSYNDFSRHGRYGRMSVNGFEKKGIAIHLSDRFSELPISNLHIGRQILPWGGGGYFRFLPFPIFKSGISRILNRSHAYMFYLHPWEIDAGQPRAEQSKGLSRWRHYLNLDKTYGRLSRLISSFPYCRFLSCSKYLEEQMTN
jgi:polysaccharide deacetylase family protein (PEP-CTERM system associated)